MSSENGCGGTNGYFQPKSNYFAQNDGDLAEVTTQYHLALVNDSSSPVLVTIIG